ncbi:MAG TPA: BlaI/MecI/CopY family transcriptional regulator [Candidatus Methylacidiphilales bacterium]
MSKPPRISEAEWEVMEVLWQQAPLTALEVVQKLAPHKEWKDLTIRSMLGRLVRKKAVGFQADGKTYHYRPRVTREECVQDVSQSFLERVFEGATASLLIHFVEKKSLTKRELAELEAILRQKKKGK